MEAAVESFLAEGATRKAAPKVLTQLHRITHRYGGIGEMDTLARMAEETDPAEPDDTGEQWTVVTQLG